MKAAAEISMYPLDKDYIPAIEAFIERLKRHEGLSVRVNAMSTQVFGPYDEVMEALRREIRETFAQPHKVAVVIKLLNIDIG